MKKNIFLLYLLPLFLVFISILAWKFWLEPLISPQIYSSFEPETDAANWEFVKTVSVFCAAALLIPALLALKIEAKRQETQESLAKLQRKNGGLSEQNVAELVRTRQQPGPGTEVQEKPEIFSGAAPITLQTLLDSISDTILVIDTNYHVIMLNRSARDLYFSDSHPVENLLCHKLSHNEDIPCAGPEYECPFKLVLKSGKSHTVVHQHIDKHGAPVPFEIQASPIFDDNGKITGIIELGRDISRRLAREQKQKEADTRLLDLQRQQSIATLAGGLAHEFNNILTSILGNAELLNIRLDDSDISKKQTKSIIAGSEHLADLTKQILAFAKGGKYLDQLISLNEQINDSLPLIQSEKFAEREVALDLADDLWPVLGDPTQINQLVMNIIINGFEALEKTEGKLNIHTANLTKQDKWHCRSNNIHQPGDYVLFSVANTGSTIPENLTDKIFDPFFSTKFTGRGMGLAAAKGIVENHHGCISLQSLSDQTTFQVLLPRALPDTDITEPSGKPAAELLNLKVLVVDDEHQVLSIITSLLKHQGCNVLRTDKGVEALEFIERHKADLDLVILDIQMPDMTGDKVYMKLKKIKPDLKVLISSGYEEDNALKNILLAPNDKYIKKPFRMSELMQKIKETMA